MNTIIFLFGTHCNLSCTYCWTKYYTEGSPQIDSVRTTDIHISNTALWDYAVYKVKQYAKKHKITLVLHGYEPTLYNPQDINKLLLPLKELVDSGNITIALETNGVHITTSWINLILQYKMKIGISIDGPKDVQNASRRDFQYNKTYSSVVKTLSKLRKEKISFGIICVITPNTLKISPKKFLQWYRHTQASNLILRFLFLPPGVFEQIYGCQFKKYKENLSQYMIHLYDIWKKTKLNIATFQMWIDGLINKGHYVLGMPCWAGQCNTVVSIHPNGTIGFCSSPMYKTNLTIKEIQTFDDISHLTPYKFFERRVRKLQRSACNGCEFFNMCKGGCPLEGYMQNGNLMDKSAYCELYSRIFMHIKEDIQNAKI